MAKYETRSPKNERTDLISQSPLSNPLTLLIEPASICSLKCVFCPTGDYNASKATGKYQGFIDLGLYEKLISDCVEANWNLKTLHLQKDGEAMLHPEFLRLCRIAKDSGVFEKVETTSNATLLRRFDPYALATCGLDRIKVSIYGISNEDYQKNCRTKIDFERLVESIKELFLACQKNNGPKIYIKTMYENLGSQERVKEFLDIFDDCCDSINVENCVENWPNYSLEPKGVQVSQSHILSEEAKSKSQKLICPQPFYNLTVCADGTALACCADWEVKNRIGEAVNQSLPELWNSDQMNEFRFMMLKGERFKHPVCGQCNYPTQVCVDNMDPGRDELLEKYGLVASL